MSGASVAYHLRTNKYVERQLFLNVLDFVRIWNGPTKYFYASMGGRFLEDFKLIHERYEIEKMLSIESDAITAKRQEFNRPLGCIECKAQSSGEFIDEFAATIASVTNAKAIVWLDYAEANNKGAQLQEYESLIEKMSSGDIVKITLNANPQSQFQRKNYRGNEFQTLVSDGLKKELEGYAPNEEIGQADLTAAGYAKLLARAVRRAALNGIGNVSDATIRPLALFRYSDGLHQMLTATAIVADEELLGTIDADPLFTEWGLRSNDWEDIHEIRIPDLSLKERAYINEKVSREAPYQIHNVMPFRLDESDPESLALLKNYVLHYRRYPAFGRVHL